MLLAESHCGCERGKVLLVGDDVSNGQDSGDSDQGDESRYNVAGTLCRELVARRAVGGAAAVEVALVCGRADVVDDDLRVHVFSG